MYLCTEASGAVASPASCRDEACSRRPITWGVRGGARDDGVPDRLRSSFCQTRMIVTARGSRLQNCSSAVPSGGQPARARPAACTGGGRASEQDVPCGAHAECICWLPAAGDVLSETGEPGRVAAGDQTALRRAPCVVRRASGQARARGGPHIRAGGILSPTAVS